MMELGDKIFLTILYIIVAALFFTYIIIAIRKKKKMGTIDYFNLYYLLVYFIVPILSFYNGYITFERRYGVFLSYDMKYHVIVLLAALIFIIFVNFFYNRLKYNPQCKNTAVNINTKRFLLINVFFSIVGIVSYYYWTKVYGFPFGVIKYASDIRDGISTIENPYSFFQPLTNFVIFAAYNWLILYKSYSNTLNKTLALIMLIITFFFGALAAFATDGRATIILFFLVPILFLSMYKKNSFKKLLILGLVAIIALGQMDAITQTLRSGVYEKKGTSNIFELVSYEFGFTYANRVNLFYNLEHGDVNISEWNDIINIIIAWVPKSLKPNNLQSLSDYNTSMFQNPSGAVPTDIVTAAIYKGRTIGILLLSLFVAFILKVFDSRFSYKKDDFTRMFTLYFCVAITLVLVAYYDLSIILFSKFAFVIYYLTIFAFCRGNNTPLNQNTIKTGANCYEKNIK